jgi:glyoxylase-like metal-dependent hydrolase (beta-lactamase superfamily II)
MTRKFIYHHDGVHYYRLSVYRMLLNVQTVYSFLVDDVLIDTGQRLNRENIYHVVRDKKLSRIILTHHHEDHSGNVAFLMRKKQIPAYAHPQAVSILSKGYSISPLGRLLNGAVDRAFLEPLKETDVVETEHHRLIPVYTPGHCDDHYCYHEPNRGWLFSGDLYVAERIKYFAPYESLLTQIGSLKKLIALDFDALFCSHNPKVTDGKQRLRNKLQFFEDFAGQVETYYRQGHNSRQIFALMGGKENYYYKVLTLGNFTAENMVRSVVHDLRKMKPA